MADITPILAAVGPVLLASPHGLGRISGTAGEAITAGYACYVKNDGLIWLTVSTVVAGAQFDGVAILPAVAGEQVTIFQQGHKINIGAHGLAIGAFLYPSDTAGLYSDAAISLGEPPIAKAISASEIEIVRMDLPAVLNP
jgi:hypothetical protein